MAFSSNRGRRRQNFNEINITPLTDVFLVLLVIMFVIAPLIDDQSALKVTPPQAKSASKSTSQGKVQTIMIEINQEGAIAVNGDVIVQKDTANDQIYDKIYAKVNEVANTGGAEKPSVKLKADSSTTHGRVVSVYDALAKAKSESKINQLILVTRAE